MKLIFICEDVDYKNAEYNKSKNITGEPLKTLSGSPIKRYGKTGVGKEIGGKIYAHKNYIHRCVPEDIVDNALRVLNDKYPGFEWNCFRYEPKTGVLAFQEAPDFDTSREPVVGTHINVFPDGRTTKSENNQIWHHKWAWVDNDYNGFDVNKSWEWSKKWLSELPEPSNGSNEANWKQQLQKYGIED